MSVRRVEWPTQINSPTVEGNAVVARSLRVAARNARTRELRFRRRSTAAAKGRDVGIQGNNIRCHGEVVVRVCKEGKVAVFQRSNLPHTPSDHRRCFRDDDREGDVGG